MQRTSDSEHGQQIDRARSLIERARRVVALTGAGISAESGVPTFRGSGGLWRGRRPESLATPEAFAADPRAVWEWYTWRRDLVASCEPNAAHRALAVAVRGGRLAIVTQNVDGMHRDAFNGPFDSAGLVELHGSLFATRCLDCNRRNDERGVVKLEDESDLPTCGSCGGLLRPDVVWFGEPLDPARWRRAVQLAEAADVCLVIGTSAVVQPAASLGGVTVRAGGVIIEVNIAATALSRQAELSLIGPASKVVPAVLGVGDAHGVPHDA